MKILGFTFFEDEPQVAEVKDPVADNADQQPEIKSLIYGDDIISTPWIPINNKSFNGEKSPGELGNPLNLVPDYRGLRARSYQAHLTTVIIRIVSGRFFQWVVGSGLKIQAEPNEKVLNLEGINEDLNAFSENVEAYFPLFAENTEADFAGMETLHDIAANAYSTAFLGGDCLVILRLDDNYNLTVQLIDGQHVQTPPFSLNYLKDAKERGNSIIHGIELDGKGTHVAYYVLKQSTTLVFGEFERVEARGKETGCLMAWMIYGTKHRIDHQRGIPQITAILETVVKLDRAAEATIAGAEERQKVPWTIEHDKYSDGENPMAAQVKRNLGAQASETGFELAKVTAKEISVTEGKTVYNLPIGSKFNSMDSTMELNYETLFKAFFLQIAASVDMPPEVALQQYNSNYSASRAAINGWGYIVNIKRKKHGFDFYQKVYDLWLYVHILKNKVSATGYVKARMEKNYYVINSYKSARFTGVNMPHIDPKKEADAIRVMLGDETTPLMTYDQATEQYGLGEWDEIIKKVLRERKNVPDLLPGQTPPGTSEPDPENDGDGQDKEDSPDSAEDEQPKKPVKSKK